MKRLPHQFPVLEELKSPGACRQSHMQLKQRDLVAYNRKNFWHLHALPSYHPKGEGSEAVETTDFTEDGPLFKVLEFCLSSPSLAPSKF